MGQTHRLYCDAPLGGRASRLRRDVAEGVWEGFALWWGHTLPGWVRDHKHLGHPRHSLQSFLVVPADIRLHKQVQSHLQHLHTLLRASQGSHGKKDVAVLGAVGHAAALPIVGDGTPPGVPDRCVSLLDSIQLVS